MKSDSTTVIKNMEFLVKELHKEWDRSGVTKASVIISLDEVDGINDKLKEIIYQTQKSVDEDEPVSYTHLDVYKRQLRMRVNSARHFSSKSIRAVCQTDSSMRLLPFQFIPSRALMWCQLSLIHI